MQVAEAAAAESVNAELCINRVLNPDEFLWFTPTFPKSQTQVIWKQVYSDLPGTKCLQLAKLKPSC